jgi:hypothetical protein
MHVNMDINKKGPKFVKFGGDFPRDEEHALIGAMYLAKETWEEAGKPTTIRVEVHTDTVNSNS